MNNPLDNQAEDFLKFLLRIIEVNCIVRVPAHRNCAFNKINFSYFHSYNNWSHKVSIQIHTEGVFFETYRMNKVVELEKYQNYNFNGREVSYLIPISERWLILKVLTEYDRFRLKK